MTKNERPKPWEVWLAAVKFEDEPSAVKRRPVLVLNDDQVYILSLKITSRPPRSGYFGEYSLLKWQEAGLHKPSTVRTSKKLQLFERDFVHKIGRLTPIDILNIIKIFHT